MCDNWAIVAMEQRQIPYLFLLLGRNCWLNSNVSHYGKCSNTCHYFCPSRMVVSFQDQIVFLTYFSPLYFRVPTVGAHYVVMVKLGPSKVQRHRLPNLQMGDLSGFTCVISCFRIVSSTNPSWIFLPNSNNHLAELDKESVPFKLVFVFETLVTFFKFNGTTRNTVWDQFCQGQDLSCFHFSILTHIACLHLYRLLFR